MGPRPCVPSFSLGANTSPSADIGLALSGLSVSLAVTQVQHIYVMSTTEVPWFQQTRGGERHQSLRRHPTNSRQNLSVRDSYVSLIEAQGLQQQLRAATYGRGEGHGVGPVSGRADGGPTAGAC